MIAEEKKPVLNRPIGLLSFLAGFVLFIVVGSYVGLFFYKNLLISQIKGLQESLASAKDSFEPETISDLQLFDKRMSVSRQVLSSHTVLSPLFDALALVTIPSIQYTSFIAENSIDGKGVSVKMVGLARDYKSIAIQASVFNSPKGKYFKDVVFSNLVLSDDKDKKGYIGFDVAFIVDPSLLSYEKQILQSNSKPKTPVILPDAPKGGIDNTNNIKSTTIDTTPVDSTNITNSNAQTQ